MHIILLRTAAASPMGVKFRMTQQSTRPLHHAKFYRHQLNEKGVGPEKLTFLLRFNQNVEYKRSAGTNLLRDFHKISELYAISGCVTF